MNRSTSFNDDYADAAKDWYYDRYETAHIHANRWFLAFVIVLIFCVLQVMAFISILPLKQWVPFVVHQNTTTGEVWVDRPKTAYAPTNDAEVEADIVRYIVSRESYTAADINNRFHTVMLLSTKLVSQRYADEQGNTNPEAPVNTLSADGIRSVHIDDIVFIDKAGSDELRHYHGPSQNLAKVDFTTTTIDATGTKTLTPWVATIGWVYKGLPQNEEDAWDNWNGFHVTVYRVDPKNIEPKRN